jgi:AcrR family transcriptional regulator
MSFRHPKQPVLSRARTPEDKAKVREAFIAAGRKLFAEEGSAGISLRRIAAQAGYAPGAIYQYFAHQQDLYFQIRAHDMHAATEQLRQSIARTRSPANRVRKLFIGTADYWLAHMEEFLMIFPSPSIRAPVVADATAEPFGRSQVVQESLTLYYETVGAFFDTLPHAPMPARLAADTLMAAVHGMIVFPCMTRTMEWSDTLTMVSQLVNTVVSQWEKTP